MQCCMTTAECDAAVIKGHIPTENFRPVPATGYEFFSD